MAGSSFFDFVLGYESDKKQGIKSSGAKRFFSVLFPLLNQTHTVPGFWDMA